MKHFQRVLKAADYSCSDTCRVRGRKGPYGGLFLVIWLVSLGIPSQTGLSTVSTQPSQCNINLHVCEQRCVYVTHLCKLIFCSLFPPPLLSFNISPSPPVPFPSSPSLTFSPLHSVHGFMITQLDVISHVILLLNRVFACVCKNECVCEGRPILSSIMVSANHISNVISMYVEDQ